MPAPRPLPENAGHVFAGEPAWPPAVIASRHAQQIGATANPSGRPNTDVLRGYVGFADYQTSERWQIDFPPHYTEQEAGLHQVPLAVLRERLGPATLVGQWWINPHAHPDLRAALARVQRYLAMPFVYSEPGWTWIEGDWLPDETLVVVARDDDFTAAVLQSRCFAEWWLAHHEESSAIRIAESFPFPWPLTRPLGSLTGLQQDLRYEASRASRAGDSVGTNAAVAKAYGWPLDLPGPDLVARLHELHQRRLSGNTSGPFPVGRSIPLL